MTSAKMVPSFAAECGEAGVKYLVIESAGFSEEGGDGLICQQQLDDTASSIHKQLLFDVVRQ